jgi:hypothetical protein
LPPDAQFDWTYNGIRPFILNLPAPRKARASSLFSSNTTTPGSWMMK